MKKIYVSVCQIKYFWLRKKVWRLNNTRENNTVKNNPKKNHNNTFLRNTTLYYFIFEVRSLGLFIFFGFVFFSLIRNFWVFSKIGFVQIFWSWLVIFAKRAEPTQKLLVFLEFWFFRIFWIWFVIFVRILSLFAFFGLGLSFLRSDRSARSPLRNFWVCSNSGLFVPVFFRYRTNRTWNQKKNA